MFNKPTNKPAPAVPAARPQPAPVTPPSADAAPRRAPRSGSSLGAGLVIDGNVSGSGDLVLDATVRGDVKVDHLVVGESGSIEGKVDAETIEVRGRIIGAITGKQVKLQATAYVEGDITHEALAIDVGAYFQGRCLQTRKVDTPAPAAAPSSTFGAPSLGSYDMNAISDLK
jgi:cytoskeletal protein CcmA (bactofilin family)